MIQSSNGKGTWQHLARTLPLSARVMGLYLLAGRVSGKSRLMGRVIAWQDFMRGIPQIICDPLGGTNDNFLDKLLRFLQYVPKSQHYRFWERIRFIDMSGRDGFITPMPLYFTRGSERSLREVAERYLQVILKSNPSLMNAQVQGWPPLHKIGVFTGMALASQNLQITSAESLLRNPAQYLSRLIQSQTQYPELAAVIEFFRDEYIPMREADRRRLTNPFMDKIFPFTIDPHLKAMFGSNTPGIDFEEVQRNRQTVLLDFRSELDPEMRRFKLLWAFSYLYEHIKLRGRNPQPFGLIIDEFAALTQKVYAGENPLAQELDEFINQYMRSANIWFTAAHQELYQISDEQMRNTLLSLGSYIIGGTSSMESARLLADALFLRDPYWVKHYRPIYGRVSQREYGVIAEEPQFMPLDEQRELFAQRIKKLGLFDFLLRPALAEGHIGSAVLPLSIHAVDRDQFPDPAVVTKVRSLLAAKSGIPVATLLAEQEARLGSETNQEHHNGNALPAPKLTPGLTDHPINRRQQLS